MTGDHRETWEGHPKNCDPKGSAGPFGRDPFWQLFFIILSHFGPIKRPHSHSEWWLIPIHGEFFFHGNISRQIPRSNHHEVHNAMDRYVSVEYIHIIYISPFANRGKPLEKTNTTRAFQWFSIQDPCGGTFPNWILWIPTYSTDLFSSFCWFDIGVSPPKKKKYFFREDLRNIPKFLAKKKSLSLGSYPFHFMKEKTPGV